MVHEASERIPSAKPYIYQTQAGGYTVATSERFRRMSYRNATIAVWDTAVSITQLPFLELIAPPQVA